MTRSAFSCRRCSALTPAVSAAIALAPSLLLAPLPAQAQIIGPGDFSPAATVDDFSGLGLAFINSGTLTRPYGVYSFDNGEFRYAPDFGAENAFGEAIGTNSDDGFINLVLDTPVLRAGGYIGGSDANVSFFDAADNLLTTVFVDYSETAPTFIGFQSGGGIARILLTDAEPTNGTILILDRTTLEAGGAQAAPEPGTAALVLGGLLPVAGYVTARRRRRKA